MKTAIKKLARVAALCSALTALSGCASISTVQPWEKGTLARPEMTFGGDKLEARFNEHIYTSREAASGGSSVGGGGCGCN
ncbi:DUF4266 domain-containing protein [Undibacterium terreum]|uniref:DUF4266 domain-containing protein n=1 Tax=Undibacterium terreum TaxID=1224302 RepID=A0A916V1I8_9BURK|nr:DUF4266 domain-containing protein [Undibacterium terreum]GGD00409.1 hypothetical protein GCM10011396_54940 [Undibacterium terreum]